MTMSVLEAFDVVSHAEVLEQRLDAAARELAARQDLVDENIWIVSARRHVARAREGIGDLPTRVLKLPELEALRGEHGRTLQAAVVDAAEHLYAAIVAAGGDRSPVLEAVYRNLKLPAMRRCHRDEFERFCRELELRLDTRYVKRMLADPSYAEVEPALRHLTGTFVDWRSIVGSGPLPDSEASVLRADLEEAARRLEGPCRQARLLAEAALLPAKELLDASGIFDKPKRRLARSARIDGEGARDVKAPDADATREGDSNVADDDTEPRSDEGAEPGPK